MSLRVLVVDDEPAARRRLLRLLADCDATVVGEAADGVAALEAVAALAPDVLLLDIAMPEVDGFDVARHLPAPRPLVIFQTAYDEYALEAFDHEALDYVVKPVTRERLSRALERARRRLKESRRDALDAATLQRLEEAVGRGGSGRRPPRLLVREGRGHRLLALADVLCFAAREGMVYAHTRERRYLTDYTLKELSRRTAGLFAPASRSLLVNLDAVERIVGSGDGGATLTLTDGTAVRVARRRAAALRAALEQA